MTTPERKKIAGRLRKAFASINEKSPYVQINDEKIMQNAIGIVKQVRTDRKAGKNLENDEAR